MGQKEEKTLDLDGMKALEKVRARVKEVKTCFFAVLSEQACLCQYDP